MNSMPETKAIPGFVARAARALTSPKLREVYLWLFQNGPLTGNEIDKALPNAHQALPNLTSLGLVRKRRKRTCRVTGKPAYEWYVTDRPFPVVPNKTESATPTRREAIYFAKVVDHWVQVWAASEHPPVGKHGGFISSNGEKVPDPRLKKMVRWLRYNFSKETQEGHDE